MRLIHCTLTWPGPVHTAVRNHQLAAATWKNGADPSRYLAAHYGPTDFPINAKMIGDPLPHVMIHHLIDKAFRESNHPRDTVLFANSDIRLINNAWPHAWQRCLVNIPNYESAIDHGEKIPTDHQWQPQSFWFPREWWKNNQHRIAPIWFPARWWEPVMHHIIGKSNDLTDPIEQCTSHTPHPRARPIKYRETPSVRWNYSVQFGWYNSGFHKPPGIGRVKIKMPKMPKDFLWKSSETPLHSPAAEPETS